MLSPTAPPSNQSAAAAVPNFPDPLWAPTPAAEHNAALSHHNFGGSLMSSSATVVADPLARIGRINPEHYSHFIEHLGECVYDGIWVDPESAIPNTNGALNIELPPHSIAMLTAAVT